jgi:hypothetical protein
LDWRSSVLWLGHYDSSLKRAMLALSISDDVGVKLFSRVTSHHMFDVRGRCERDE